MSFKEKLVTGTTPFRYLVNFELDAAPAAEECFAAWLLEVQPTAHLEIVFTLADRVSTWVLDRTAAADTRGKLEDRLSKIRDRLVAARIDTCLLEGHDVGETLMDEADRILADAVVVRRRASIGGRHVVRLGREVRHTLSHLRRPVIVLPADLEAVPSGPVLLGTDLQPGAEGAARWASKWCAATKRSLSVAHVLPDLQHQTREFLPPRALTELAAEQRERGSGLFADWRQACDLEDADPHLLEGEAADRLEGLANEQRACLLVLGSNARRGLERRIAGVGWEMAGGGRVPVAIVPPSYAGVERG